jgi:Collagenase NC10 and Endostatin
MTKKSIIIASVAVCALAASAGVQAQQANNMSFFVTSAGSGKGADLGGIEGADRHCQQLAQGAGASGTWRAYLSTQAAGGGQAVNARDRIGRGPWRNAKGEVIAQNVDDLHSANNKITKQSALTEKGQPVNGRGDTPNMHDILTGSQADGRAFAGGDDMTCKNWTSSGEGAAMVGHHDRQGLRDDDASKSWNTSHPSRGQGGGCSQDALKGTGGAGLFYCFAAN